MLEWLRKAVKNAFLAGVKDAVEELQLTPSNVGEVVLELDYQPYQLTQEPKKRKER